jgi:hypothetical protein
MAYSKARRERAAIMKQIKKDLKIHKRAEKRKAEKLAKLAAEGKEPSPAEGLNVVARDDIKVAPH